MQVLMVRVRGEAFGIPAADVIEVIRAVAVNELPGSPAVISGAINMRGETVVVIDPAVRFGKAAKPVRPEDNFVLVKAATRTVAIRVDIADELVEIDGDALTKPEDASSTLDMLYGVAATPDGALVIYDVAAFLTQAEDEALAEALTQTATSQR